jgi:hypothetical protein
LESTDLQITTLPILLWQTGFGDELLGNRGSWARASMASDEKRESYAEGCAGVFGAEGFLVVPERSHARLVNIATHPLEWLWCMSPVRCFGETAE